MQKKIIKVFIVTILICIFFGYGFCVGAYQIFPYDLLRATKDLIVLGPNISTNSIIELQKARDIVLEKHPEIAEKHSDLDVVIGLMNMIHHDVPLKNPSQGYVYNGEYSKILDQAISDPTITHICEGLSINFAIAVKSFGIPVRRVALFDATKSPYNSHATTEVFIDGNWIIADPTFNVMFTDLEGNLLKYLDLLDTDYKVLQFEAQPRRRLDEYYMPLEPLLNFIYIQATNISEEIIYPIDWNVKIDSKTIKTYSGSFWDILVRTE